MSLFSLDRWLTLPQYLLPQHWLTYAAGWLAEVETAPIKNLLINLFIQVYHVNMNEALYPNADHYKHFNDFFTRPLVADARPFDDNPSKLISPADGTISQQGKINDGAIFQAKGFDFTVFELLGGSRERSQPYLNGQFSTIYLSPKDYHRVHMPKSGTLREMIYIPGDLFSVNNRTSENVPRLFSRNERVVAIFDSEQGPFALVLVGAMIVGSMETVWHGTVAPGQQVQTYNYKDQNIFLKKGEEMGRFKLGSTVILCFPEGQVEWDEQWQHNSPVKMGETLGKID